MTKSKELQLFRNEFITNIEGLDDMVNQYIKKIKKEYAQILIDEKNKLLIKIAEGENLDLNILKSKYLKAKELNNVLTPDYVIYSVNNEELLDKIVLNDNTYYYENKEKGKVYDVNYTEIGYYKNNDVFFY